MMSIRDIKKSLPNTYQCKIKEYRDIINNILCKKDKRFLIIVGPCSVHKTDEVIEYAKFLNSIQKMYDEKIFLVMRVYAEKPRSTGTWTGFINDPDLNNSNNIEKGIFEYRKLCLELCELGIPIAVEMLCPITFNYFEDLVSFCSIGARTSESQIHRNFLSNLEISCGVKNDMKGDIEVSVQGVNMVTQKHIFLNINEDGMVKKINSDGNKNCAVILRGSLINGPNYDFSSVKLTKDLLDKYQLENNIIIDASHGNSNKNFKEQINVIENVLSQKKKGDRKIIGIMIESFINEGKQNMSDTLKYGISITDGCLGQVDTKKIIDIIYKNI